MHSNNSLKQVAREISDGSRKWRRISSDQQGLSRPLNDPEEMARESVLLTCVASEFKKREHTGRGPAAGYALIDQMRAIYRVVELCQALAVSRSGYYRWHRGKAGARRRQNRLLLSEIKRIHADRHTRCYGSPRMSVELNQRGFRCSVNRVARLMKQNALKACRGSPFRPKTTRQDPRSLPAPNRLAEAPDPTGPGQIMVSDITYIPTRQGWLYLAVVMDLFGQFRATRWPRAWPPVWSFQPFTRPGIEWEVFTKPSFIQIVAASIPVTKCGSN